MAPVYSKYSSAMPVPQNVKMCPKNPGVDLSTTMITTSSGAYTMLICFRQPAKNKYAFQAQYRFRHVLANGTYEDWSTWRSCTTVNLGNSAKTHNVAKSAGQTGYPFPYGTTQLTRSSAVNPDWWLTCNVGMNSKSSYKTAMELQTRTLDPIYAAIEWQVRVRTYDPNTRLHSGWGSGGILTVCRSKAPKYQGFFKGVNGGLRIEMIVPKADAGGIFRLWSVKDAKGRELLQKNFAGTASNNSYPLVAPSAGHVAITRTIGREMLKRNIAYGEVLTINGRYETKTGTITKLSSKVRVSSTNAVFDGIDIRSTFNEENGVLVVSVRRKDANDKIEKCSCNLTYTYNGKKYSIAPTSTVKNIAGTYGTKKTLAKFTFKGVPNVASTSKISVTISATRYGVQNQTFSLSQKLGGNLFIFTGITYKGTNATCWLDGAVTQAVKGTSALRLPEGSTLPFATIKKGRTNTITFTGTILDKDPRFASAGRLKWEAFAKKGACICQFVSPAGHKAKVLIESVTLTQSIDGTAQVTVNMQEVR